MRFLFGSLLILCLYSCVRRHPLKEARKKSDLLLEMIAEGTGQKEFSQKYFPSNQSATILSDLKNNCDFANRKGGFRNHFYQKKIGQPDLVSFIYEFNLSCDNIRFILTYKICTRDSFELCKFDLEPIEKQNTMLIN